MKTHSYHNKRKFHSKLVRRVRMLSVQKDPIKNNISKFKIDAELIEQAVKKWEEEFRLADFNSMCKECKTAFIELQCDLTKEKDLEKRQAYEKRCYDIISSLLSKIEINLSPDHFEYVYKSERTKAFNDLWNYFHQYCINIEQQYPWSRLSE